MAFFRKIILGVATKQPSRVPLCITQARLSSNLIDASDSDIIQPHIKLKEANEKHLKEISRVKHKDGSLTIEGKRLPLDDDKLIVDMEKGACPLCSLGLEVKYTDLLILRQFMRRDGSHLPRSDTGLCAKQQRYMIKLIHQAHNAGLLTELRPNIGRERKPDKASYYKFKGFNRYFTDNY